jgi:hypothetical protein
MSKGPRIKEEEVSKARQLKAEGHKAEQIAEQLKRSLPSVYKMLRTLQSKDESLEQQG